MSKQQSSTAVFTNIIGIEEPAITGLRFETFFGDGTLNSSDGTNLVPGGTTFANIGTGPVMSPNFGAVTPVTASLDTGLSDPYPLSQTLIVVASAAPLPATIMQFSPIGSNGAALCFFNRLVTQPGLMTFNINSTAMPLATTAWAIYAWVWTIGSPLVLYDLTQNLTVSSAAAMQQSGHPTAGTWQIGAGLPNSGFVNPINVAYALGANSAVNITQLNQFAAALRFYLIARGITGA